MNEENYTVHVKYDFIYFLLLLLVICVKVSNKEIS